MNALGAALVAVGAIVAILSFLRARDPWRRYAALRAQDENTERYRAWRGGPAGAAEETTGASVAMAMLRRRALTWGAVAGVGLAAAVVGLLLVLG